MTGQTILIIGLILLLGFLLGNGAEKIGLPKITGYLMAGILLNPGIISYIPTEFPDNTEPIVDLCLAFITFEVGFSLSISKIRKHGTQLLAVSGLEAFGAFLIVFFGFVALAPLLGDQLSAENFATFAIPFSLLIAALAAPTDPSATLAVMHQYKAKGPVSETIIGCAAFDDAFTLIIYSICFTMSSMLMGDVSTSFGNVVGQGLASILGAVAVGAFVGLVLNYLTRWFSITAKSQLLVILLAAIAIAFGVSSFFAFDELLSTLVLGVIAANFNIHHQLIKEVVERYTEELIFVFFFVLSAMHLDFSSVGNSWYFILLFIILRTVGKYLGALAGLSITRSPAIVKKYTFSGLIPQGGIVMGLALMMQKNPIFDAFSPIIVSTVMGATIFHEFAGPTIAKWGLKKAHELAK
ncbi:MAG: cation:proton antiporter [Cyclobacteriaceae bacterium]